MFDATKLLEQLLGPQGAATAKGYIDQGSKTVEGLVGADTLAKGKDLFGKGLSSLDETATQVVGAERMAQAKDFASKNSGGLAIGAAAGGLLGLLVGTDAGRKVGGTALELGALAALGGLAYKAYQNWQGQAAAPEAVQPAAPAPDASAAPAPTPAEEEAKQKLAAATIIASAPPAIGTRAAAARVVGIATGVAQA